MSKDSKLGHRAKILTFHPTGEYYFNKGLKAFHRRDLLKAKKYFERALELEPLEPMIACQLAVTCTEIGEYSYSNHLLENILETLDPYMTECHYFLANNYAHLGMFEEAYRHANAYLDKEEEGEFSEEAEDLLEIITFETDENEDSLFSQESLIINQEKAREYLEAGNFPKAIEVLNEMIEEYEDYWSAYNNLALAYFYLGKIDEAFATLEDVLEKSPGNLHALCNLVVFHFYQQNEKEVEKLVEVLAKIRPILTEHRFKLGATFALIGKYSLAYKWLKKLQKQRFEGDGSYYFWLATSAYHLGHEQTAHKAWSKVVELNPEKEGTEPWGDNNIGMTGYEHHLPSVLKRLESSYIEERLFGIFLMKHSKHKQSLINHKAVHSNSLFTSLEKEYVEFVKHSNGQRQPLSIDFADRVSELLYQSFKPIKASEAGIFLMWFSVFVEAKKANYKFQNPSGWAAALEYIWYGLRDERKSQTVLAEKYYISTATISKYVKLVHSFLD